MLFIFTITCKKKKLNRFFIRAAGSVAQQSASERRVPCLVPKDGRSSISLPAAQSPPTVQCSVPYAGGVTRFQTTSDSCTSHGPPAYQHLLGLEGTWTGVGMASPSYAAPPTFSTTIPFTYENMKQRSRDVPPVTIH